jgi:hypothetical protein
MKLSRLQITIEPWHINPATRVLRVEATVNGIRHSNEQPFDDCDFESAFDRLMDRSKRELNKIIKAHGITPE